MFEDIFERASFWVLSGVGYFAFAIMVITLKKMGNGEFMPLWVKLIVLVVIPVVAALFSGYAEG